MVKSYEFVNRKTGRKTVRFGGSVNGIEIPYDYRTAGEVERVIRGLR